MSDIDVTDLDITKPEQGHATTLSVRENFADIKNNLGIAKTELEVTEVHAANTTNPHTVTAGQVGLGNVDNTSDADKPVSSYTISALDLKADLMNANVVTFGADKTGATDSAVAIQAAVDSLTLGGIIDFPPGTYRLETRIDIPDKIILNGSGIDACRINCISNLQPFKFLGDSGIGSPNGGGIRDFEISMDGSSAAVDKGIEVIDQWGWFCHRVRFRDGGTNGVTSSIHCSGLSFEVDIRNCRFEYGGDHSASRGVVHLEDDCNGSLVADNDFAPDDGGIAVYVADANNVRVNGNHFEFASGDGGTHVFVHNADGTIITDNSMGSNLSSSYTEYAVYIDGTSYRTVVANNRLSVSAGYGVFLASAAHTTVITGNAFEIASGVGIDCNGRPDTTISGNACFFTGTFTAGIKSGASGGAITITGNTMRGHITPTVGAGVLIDTGALIVNISGNFIRRLTKAIDCDANAGSQTILLNSNVFSENTIDIDIASVASVKVNDNIGFVTENSGSDTVASGGTTSYVTHGLDYTPDASDINITQTNSPTNSPGNIFITTISTTVFVVNIENDPGASGVDFSWSVRRG